MVRIGLIFLINLIFFVFQNYICDCFPFLSLLSSVYPLNFSVYLCVCVICIYVSVSICFWLSIFVNLYVSVSVYLTVSVCLSV